MFHLSSRYALLFFVVGLVLGCTEGRYSRESSLETKSVNRYLLAKTPQASVRFLILPYVVNDTQNNTFNTTSSNFLNNLSTNHLRPNNSSPFVSTGNQIEYQTVQKSSEGSEEMDLSLTFSEQNTLLLPSSGSTTATTFFEITLEKPIEFPYTIFLEGKKNQEIVQKEDYVVYGTPEPKKIRIYPFLFDFPIKQITVRSRTLVTVESISYLNILDTPDTPLPLSLPVETAISYPKDFWRQEGYEFFRSAEEPDIFLFLFNDYALQAKFLKRLVFFVEKKDSRGRLRSDEYLANRHGWNAQDYRSSDLARFFNEAKRERFTLKEEEKVFLNHLLSFGILSLENGEYRGRKSSKGGDQAVISLSLESYPALLKRLLQHEFAHGLFFISDGTQREIEGLWNELSPLAQEKFREYLALSNYDITYDLLVRNELFGYLMGQVNPRSSFLYRSSLFSSFNGKNQRLNDEIAQLHPKMLRIIQKELKTPWQSYFSRIEMNS